MRISNINLYNYRIYKGLNGISFEDDENRNIHIVSGFNGFGKTTFLTSLVWCLYGAQMQDVDDSFKKRIKDIGGYPKFLEDSLNRDASLNQETNYFVEISFSGVDVPGIIAEELTIKRSFTKGDRIDNIQIWLDGQPNELVQEVGFDLFIQDFILPKEIAKFFFFDAEKITELAEIQNLYQKRQLGKAYSEVLGIKKYVDLKSNLQEQRLKYRRDSANSKEVKSFEQIEFEIEVIEKDLIQQSKLNEEYKEEIIRTNDLINELQERLIRAGNVLSLEEHNELLSKKEYLIKVSDELKEDFKRLLDLAPFAISGKLFSQLSKSAQFEKNKISTDSYNKLLLIIEDLKQKSNVLPNDISQDNFKLLLNPLLTEYNSISQLNNDYIQTNKLGLSEKSILIIEHIENQLLHKYQDDIKQVTRNMKRNRYDLNEVNKMLSRAESKTDDILVVRNRSNLHVQQNNLQELYLSLGRTEEKITSLTNELNSRKKIREELQKKVNLQKDLIEKDDLANRLIHELDSFILKIQEKKKLTLQNRIRETLKNLMHKLSFISDVRIHIENELIDIDLIDSTGEIINKEGLSMGEKQLYATSILHALVQESNFDFPVFIDSPMQKLDATHATNIMKYFYPSVSKQVILLPLLIKEMSEKEFKVLEPYVKSSNIIYHKVENSSSTFLHVANTDLFETINSLYDKNYA